MNFMETRGRYTKRVINTPVKTACQIGFIILCYILRTVRENVLVNTYENISSNQSVINQRSTFPAQEDQFSFLFVTIKISITEICGSNRAKARFKLTSDRMLWVINYLVNRKRL